MKVLRFIDDNLEEYVLAASFVVTIALIFVQVVCRYVLRNSLSWSEELARYIFVWQIWLGAAYAAKIDKHINITVVRERLPQKTQIVLDFLVLAIWLAFSLFMVVRGIDVVNSIFKMKQRSPALQIPMGIPYMAVPVGCALMSFRVAQKIVTSLPGWKKRWS